MMTWTWPETPARATLVAGVLVVALVAFVSPAIVHAFGLWSTTEEFNYGFLILPAAAGMMWSRWGRIRAAVGAGDPLGLVVAAFAALGFLVAERIGVHAAAGVMVTPLLVGIVLYLWGRKAAIQLAFPLAFLAFGLAPYRGLLDTVGFSLQVATAHGSGWLAELAGLPVTRDGLVLQLPAFAFVVAEACSGMSSLLSLLALSSAWIYFAAGGAVARIVVIAAVLPIVLIANVMRVTIVLGVADRFGPEVATGFFHGASSLVLFGVALACLVALSEMVGCRLRIAR